MATLLAVTIVTPTGIAYQGEVSELTVMTTTGEITILPNHIPLVSSLKPGELRIKKDAEVFAFALDRGVIEADTTGEVTLLVESSQSAFDLDESELEAAIARAQQAMMDKDNTLDIDFARFQSILERDINKLKVARKWRK